MQILSGTWRPNTSPDTIFVTTSGSTIRANVAPIVFELEEATFVLGFLGAKLSARSKVGAIGGVKIPSVESTFTAFAAGATRARPHADVTVSYIGSWTVLWPGLGITIFRAIGAYDTPVIVGSTIIYAYLLAMTVFLLDFVYALVDPRVKIGSGNSQ